MYDLYVQRLEGVEVIIQVVMDDEKKRCMREVGGKHRTAIPHRPSIASQPLPCSFMQLLLLELKFPRHR